MTKITINGISLNPDTQNIEDLSKIDEVRHIEEFVPPQLFNNVALRVLNGDRTHSTAALEGEGQVVAVCDTGFDKGSTTDVHPAFTTRVVKLHALGRSTANDPDGRCTHVTGSVLGDGKSGTMEGQIRGAVPRAKLVLQSVLDRQGGLGGFPTI